MGHWGGKTKSNDSGTCEIKSFPSKEAIQKPHSPRTTVRMVTHHGGLQIPKLCWEHFTGQLNPGCRHALLSEPTATYWLHHISPHWLTYYEGGPSQVTERNPTDTLPVSFEETLSTSLSSQQVPACKGRGNTPAVRSCTPGWEDVWGFSCSLKSDGEQLLLSCSLAAYNPHEIPGRLLQRSSSSPPFTHCKEGQQQLNCLFYSPSSLYGNGIDHSSLLV